MLAVLVAMAPSRINGGQAFDSLSQIACLPTAPLVLEGTGAGQAQTVGAVLRRPRDRGQRRVDAARLAHQTGHL